MSDLTGPAAIFEQMWRSSERECAELQAENERLRAENEQLKVRYGPLEPSQHGEKK